MRLGQHQLKIDSTISMIGERPFVFTNLKTGQGLDIIVDFIQRQGLMQ